MRWLPGRLRMSLEAKAFPEIEAAEAERKADLFRKAFETDVEMAWRPLRDRAKTNGAVRGPRLHVVAAS